MESNVVVKFKRIVRKVAEQTVGPKPRDAAAAAPAGVQTAAKAAVRTWVKQVARLEGKINSKVVVATSATGLTVLFGGAVFGMMVSKKDIYHAVCDNVAGALKSLEAIASQCTDLPIFLSVAYDKQLNDKKCHARDGPFTHEEYFLRRGLQESLDMQSLAAHSPGKVTAISVQHDIKSYGTTKQVTVMAMYAYQTRRTPSGNLELVYAEIPDTFDG